MCLTKAKPPTIKYFIRTPHYWHTSLTQSCCSKCPTREVQHNCGERSSVLGKEGKKWSSRWSGKHFDGRAELITQFMIYYCLGSELSTSSRLPSPRLHHSIAHVLASHDNQQSFPPLAPADATTSTSADFGKWKLVSAERASDRYTVVALSIIPQQLFSLFIQTCCFQKTNLFHKIFQSELF